VPPAGTSDVINYELNVVGQSALLLAVGGFFYWRAREKA
jgi:hypothetical protein